MSTERSRDSRKEETGQVEGVQKVEEGSEITGGCWYDTLIKAPTTATTM